MNENSRKILMVALIIFLSVGTILLVQAEAEAKSTGYQEVVKELYADAFDQLPDRITISQLFDALGYATNWAAVTTALALMITNASALIEWAVVAFFAAYGCAIVLLITRKQPLGDQR